MNDVQHHLWPGDLLDELCKRRLQRGSVDRIIDNLESDVDELRDKNVEFDTFLSPRMVEEIKTLASSIRRKTRKIEQLVSATASDLRDLNGVSTERK
jgi:hypothetical protein